MNWNHIGRLEEFNICVNAPVSEKTINKLIPASNDVLSLEDKVLLEKSFDAYELEYELYTLKIRQTKFLVRNGLFVVLTSKKNSIKNLCFLRYLETSYQITSVRHTISPNENPF